MHIVTSHLHHRRAELLFRAVLGSGYHCSFSLVAEGTTPAEIALRLLEPMKLSLLPRTRLRRLREHTPA